SPARISGPSSDRVAIRSACDSWREAGKIREDNRMAQLPLNGAVALVTGAARGIGRGCALELARAGADVAVVDVQHAEEAQAVAAEIERLGRRARFWPADAGDRAAMARVVAANAQQ